MNFLTLRAWGAISHSRSNRFSESSIDMKVTQTEVRGRFYTEYEFGPHGLEFNKATTLRLPLPYANGTWVTLRWFNPDSDQWEVQERKQVRSGKVEFSIYHFSKYGINTVFENLEGFPADWKTNAPAFVKFVREHQCPSFLEYGEYPYVSSDEIKKALKVKAAFSHMLDQMQ